MLALVDDLGGFGFLRKFLSTYLIPTDFGDSSCLAYVNIRGVAGGEDSKHPILLKENKNSNNL